MNCDHSHGHDRKANATLVVLLFFIAAIVATVESYRDEIEADETHHSH